MLLFSNEKLVVLVFLRLPLKENVIMFFVFSCIAACAAVETFFSCSSISIFLYSIYVHFSSLSSLQTQ